MADETTARDGLPSLPRGLPRSGLTNLPLSLVITDPHQDDNPIVYVNRAFTQLTGYEPGVVIGRNCRFLQGEDSEPEVIQRLRDAIEDSEEVTVDLTNYRANGEAFLNRLMITPLRNKGGEITHFLGVQTEYSGRTEAAAAQVRLDEALAHVQHEVRNHLSMIIAMTRLEADSGESGERTGEVLADRMEAISLAYEIMPQPARSDARAPLSAYLTQLIAARLRQNGSNADLVIDVGDAHLGATTTVRIGLVFGEALRHTGAATLAVKVVRDAGAVTLTIRTRQETDDWPDDGSLSGQIASSLTSSLHGRIWQSEAERGSDVRLRISIS